MHKLKNVTVKLCNVKRVVGIDDYFHHVCTPSSQWDVPLNNNHLWHHSSEDSNVKPLTGLA
jgi:hypothetical protein